MPAWIPIVLTLSGVTPIPVGGAGVDLGELLRSCAAMDDAAERLACYDRVARRVEEAAEAGEPVTAPTTQEPSEDVFGLPPSGPPAPPELAARVEKLGSTARGKLLIELDNGQVWEQIDSRRAMLKDGAAVVIRKAALGSFLLRAEGSSRAIRVKRVK